MAEREREGHHRYKYFPVIKADASNGVCIESCKGGTITFVKLVAAASHVISKNLGTRRSTNLKFASTERPDTMGTRESNQKQRDSATRTEVERREKSEVCRLGISFASNAYAKSGTAPPL